MDILFLVCDNVHGMHARLPVFVYSCMVFEKDSINQNLYHIIMSNRFINISIHFALLLFSVCLCVSDVCVYIICLLHILTLPLDHLQLHFMKRKKQQCSIMHMENYRR